MVEAVLIFTCMFTIFYGMTCVVDEIEEARRVNRGLEMLKKERLARLERLKK